MGHGFCPGDVVEWLSPGAPMNEAAERLRNRLMAFTVDQDQWATDAALLDAAFAAERRATVERIRSAVDWNVPEHAELEQQLAAILDEEAAR